MGILKQEIDSRMKEAFDAHGWVYEITETVADGEAFIITVSKRGERRQIALLYPYATSNRVYRRLDGRVDTFVIQGGIQGPNSFTQGVTKPIITLGNLNRILLEWDAQLPDSIQDKEAPSIEAHQEALGLIMSENPLEQIWTRIAGLRSRKIAENILRIRYEQEGKAVPDSVLSTKAEGISFSMQNSFDYFRTAQSQSLTQKILNLYYGTVAFMIAETLVNDTKQKSLSDIEDVTKQGHGLYTVDTGDSPLDFVTGVIQSGLFSSWLRSRNFQTDSFPPKKPRKKADLIDIASDYYFDLPSLFSRIPELKSLLFTIDPRLESLSIEPNYDMMANHSGGFLPGDNAKIAENRTLVRLSDWTGTLTIGSLRRLAGPLSHFEVVKRNDSDSGDHFSAIVTHPDKKYWHQALNIHRTPYSHGSLIVPILGNIDDWEVVVVVVLYSLSILVRYRPSAWRQIFYGDWDHYKALFEELTVVTERVIPEIFLNKITGISFRAVQPGSMFA